MVIAMEAVERDHIFQVLVQTRWKVSGSNSASEIMGLDRSTLSARMAFPFSGGPGIELGCGSAMLPVPIAACSHPASRSGSEQHLPFRLPFPNC